MSCCNNNNCCNQDRGDRDFPDGVDPCCNVRGRCCVCLPYDDPWAISAQILSIVAVFFSWVWWVTFVISIIGMTILQVLWCARMRSGPVYGHVAIAGLTSALSLAVAIYVLVAWKRKRWCEPFVLYTNDFYYDDDRYNYDNCEEKTWFAIALVCSLLWAAAAGCLFYFVKGGRHARWEETHSNTAGANNPDTQRVDEGEAVVADAAVLESSKVDDV